MSFIGFVIFYYEQDEFASLPAIVPDGPIAIYGLVRNSFISCFSDKSAFSFVLSNELQEFLGL